MRNQDKGAGDFLRLKAEAEAIKKEVESDETVKGLEVTPEMDKKMERLIKACERRKSEAPVKAEKPPAHFRHKRMNKKVIVLIAAALVMLFGISMTSAGSRQIFKQLINDVNNDESLIQIDTDEEEKITSEADDEDRIYEEISEVLGIEPVRITYMPDSAVFQTGQIDEGLRMAYIVYANKGDVVYQIFAEFDESSAGVGIDESIVNQYKIQLPETEVFVKEYIKKEGENIREAIFEYKDNYYVLSGSIEKDEFEQIIKNLHFF